jgi:hypothetical protein
MKNYKLLIVTFFVVFVSCNKKVILNKGVELTILNNELNCVYLDSNNIENINFNYKKEDKIKAKNIVTYIITNKTKKRLFFPKGLNFIPFSGTDIDSLDPYPLEDFCFMITNSNSNRKVKDRYKKYPMPIFAKTRDSLINNKAIELGIKNYLYSEEMLNNSFILYPNQSKTFQTLLYLPILNEQNNLESDVGNYLIFDKSENYQFSLIYTCLGYMPEHPMPKYIEDDLKRNKVEVFHGTLKSNKVPIKILN